MAKPNLTIPVFTEEQIKLLWSRIDKHGDNECWPWTHTLKQGYGHISLWNQNFKPHRVVYFLHYGQWPGKMFVCHKCDHPACCNPEHLFLGTAKDNMRDMIRKDRANYTGAHKPTSGDNHGMAKLAEIQVLEIRDKFAVGDIKAYQLADLYNISRTTISRILLRQTWKHI